MKMLWKKAEDTRCSHGPRSGDFRQLLRSGAAFKERRIFRHVEAAFDLFKHLERLRAARPTRRLG